MKKLITCLLSSALLLGATGCNSEDYTRHVNPFIGTEHEGHCFPGATVPMGMVQVSPESTTDFHAGYCADHVAGYQYSDPRLAGFTQTHINGAGCPSLSDILLMPYCGREIDPAQRKNFESHYDKSGEVATPGYYAVKMTDNATRVELTATEHAAWHKYTFDHPESGALLIDLQYGVGWHVEDILTNVITARQKVGERTISGYRKARQWAERDLYYTMEFSAAMDSVTELEAPDGAEEAAPRYLVTFEGHPEVLEVRIGLSTTSIAAAEKNLKAEIAKEDTFETIRKRASDKWNNILSRVDAEGDDDRLTMIYTALYHLYTQPNNIADVDGNYTSAEGRVEQATDGKFMSTLSLWDTYRAAHPMYTLLTPSVVPQLCSSIMDHYKTRPEKGADAENAHRYLPRWALWGKETNTMIGNHAVPVLVDAYLKGLFPEERVEELYEAVVTTLTKTHYRNHITLIDRYGYIPYDVTAEEVDDQSEAVSRLLEGAYDFHCAALLAERLGHREDAEYFRLRAADYKNVYDPASGFMRGRNAEGQFKTGIDVNQVVGEWIDGSDFTEANAWHYRFHVQHDIPGLRDLMGGEKVLGERLDSMFYSQAPKPYVKDIVWNLYGTLGQYWHGNEPCHHVPYLYKYTDRGYKADAVISYLADNFSKNTPDGLKGNDDCGQMSAWYLFAVMGFYPVDPCGGEFVLGAPQIPYCKLRLENGREFAIRANGFSPTARFVKAVRLNGQPVTDITISYDQIMNGGTLEFDMEERPDMKALHDFKI